MMELTKQEFRNEYLFSVTMSHVRSMLRSNLISQAEYCQMHEKMKQKYHPVTDGLISESDLQTAEKHGLIRPTESVEEVKHEADSSRISAGMPLHHNHGSRKEDANGDDTIHSRLLEDEPENEVEV